MIRFSWTNDDTIPKTMNFRVRLYTDAGRTVLAFTFDTDVSQVGWTASEAPFPQGGVSVNPGATVSLTLTPTGLTENFLYYGLVDSYDGIDWTDPEDIEQVDYVPLPGGDGAQFTGPAITAVESIVWPDKADVRLGLAFGLKGERGQLPEPVVAPPEFACVGL